MAAEDTINMQGQRRWPMWPGGMAQDMSEDFLLKVYFVTILLALAGAMPASAATLYRWTDAGGTTRYGYQPPPGTEAEPADEVSRDIDNQFPSARCPDLAQEHLALIDREVARIRTIPAGLGPSFELSPALKQQLILDLLAHRAALVTGRAAAEFRSPGGAELEQLKQRMEREKRLMETALKEKDEMIDRQQNRLEQAERPNFLSRHLPHPRIPAIIPAPPAGH